MKIRKSAIALLSVPLVLGSSCSQIGQDGKGIKPPNIIFIMTDDQSAIVPQSEDSTLPFYDGNNRGVQSRPFGFNGDDSVHTPLIDSLARNGMIFTRAYVSSTVCAPSRYTTLTGRYAGRCEGSYFMRLHPTGTLVRVENNTELEEHRDNLPRLLQKAGYRTGFVGKSHLVDHDLLNQGSWAEHGLETYDYYDNPKVPEVNEKMRHNHSHWVNRIKEFGFDYANGVYAANLRELFNDSLNVHNLEWINKAALEFIDQAADEPFFLYYSETIPHGPAPWINRDGKYPFGLDANPEFTGEGYVPEAYEYMPDRDAILKEVIQAGKDSDHAWLTWFDKSVGAVINKLKEKGILDNTLIIITSDHGNYNYQKSTIYEGGVKIPLMMYWPAGIPAGSVYEEFIQNIDFAPTFLDLAGLSLDVAEHLDGESFGNVLLGESLDPVHDHLFFELGFARGVMTKEWKYISVRYDEATQRQVDNGTIFTGWNQHSFTIPYYTRNSHLGYHAAQMSPNYFDKDQLYDLINDPGEHTNVVELFPEKVDELREILIEYLESFPDRPYGEFVQTNNPR